MNPNSFGMHLILDCYKCNPEKLNNPKFLKNLLNSLTKEIQMTKISEPIVMRYNGNDKKDSGGYSGFVMIAESHISFHSFPFNKGFMTMDIYSCKDFEAHKAIKLISKELESKKNHPIILERGIQFK